MLEGHLGQGDVSHIEEQSMDRPAERVVQARVLFLLRDPGGALRDTASPLIHCTNTDDGLTEWRIADAPLNACERELCRDFLAWLLTRFPPSA